MEFENIDQERITEESNSGIDLRELIFKYSRYWKWFLLTFIISIITAYIKLNFARPQYQATTIIKIKDENSGDKSTLSAFQDLGIITGNKQNIEDEIEILKSKSLISEVVKTLKLNVFFFTDKNKVSNLFDNYLGMHTEFYEKERYTDPPININFLIPDSLLYKTEANFLITIKSNTTFIFSDKQKTFTKQNSFGERINTNFGNIIITPNVDFVKDTLIGTSINVSILPLEKVVNSYAEKISIEPKSQLSSIVTLTTTDGDQNKVEDFLDMLVIKYNQRAITLKEELTKATSDFVSSRLEKISQELSDVDEDAESLKRRYKLSDVASETGLNMQSGQELDKQIVTTNAQLENINAMKDFVSNKDENDLIPLNVGIEDSNVSLSSQQYNQLMMEKNRLLKTSTEKNPTVVNIDEQLKKLKNNIIQGLDNLESSQQISLDALTKQGARISSKLYSVPQQERQYRDIKRQQQIKEQLYLYLLQKREETAITLGIADPNAKIIDYAESLPNRKSPKKKLFFLIAGFIGLLIPLGVLYLKDMLDNKFHTREEVEKILNIPIIGDIPKLETKERYLISKSDYSGVAEAFRILRTNLSFILSNTTTNTGSVIFVTSTIAGEGKSMVSTNLATSLAYAGKKTIILGLDIRAPKLKSYLGTKGEIGITNFVIDKTITPKDLIVKISEIDNLDIITSGDIAPNPAELLMNLRIKDLFDFARQNYEYIIVDTAAFSMVTDTLLISRFADAFIYVIRANYLDKRTLKFVKSVYKEKRLPNMTILINGIDHKKGFSYGYGYGYGVKYDQTKKKNWLSKIFS